MRERNTSGEASGKAGLFAQGGAQRASGRGSGAAYTIALTPRQYLSHIERKRGCPPRSHSLIVTLPLVTLRMLKPTVGIMSSENPPVCEGRPVGGEHARPTRRVWTRPALASRPNQIERAPSRQGGRQRGGRRRKRGGGRAALTATTLTSVVLPEFCRPTSVSSISCLKKRLRPPCEVRMLRQGLNMRGECGGDGARRGPANVRQGRIDPALEPRRSRLGRHRCGRDGSVLAALAVGSARGHVPPTPAPFPTTTRPWSWRPWERPVRRQTPQSPGGRRRAGPASLAPQNRIKTAHRQPQPAMANSVWGGGWRSE